MTKEPTVTVRLTAEEILPLLHCGTGPNVVDSDDMESIWPDLETDEERTARHEAWKRANEKLRAALREVTR